MCDAVRPQQRDVDVHARGELQETHGDPVVVERLDRGGSPHVDDRVAELTFGAKRRVGEPRGLRKGKAPAADQTCGEPRARSSPSKRAHATNLLRTGQPSTGPGRRHWLA